MLNELGEIGHHKNKKYPLQHQRDIIITSANLQKRYFLDTHFHKHLIYVRPTSFQRLQTIWNFHIFQQKKSKIIYKIIAKL
jgi:hypothetical protein